jgi:hypothetical protein
MDPAQSDESTRSHTLDASSNIPVKPVTTAAAGSYVPRLPSTPVQSAATPTASAIRPMDTMTTGMTDQPVGRSLHSDRFAFSGKVT